MSGERWLRVPVGDEAARWRTVGSCRTVLPVARTVTSAGRLLEILPVVPVRPSRAGGVHGRGRLGLRRRRGDYLRGVQARTVPWSQAVETPFHLAAPG
ncbi:hypothetical protein ACWDRB_49280 [Nonomuraea sp. NPDC003707]